MSDTLTWPVERHRVEKLTHFGRGRLVLALDDGSALISGDYGETWTPWASALEHAGSEWDEIAHGFRVWCGLKHGFNETAPLIRSMKTHADDLVEVLTLAGTFWTPDRGATWTGEDPR